MKIKICSKKDCPFGGAPQPTENFSKASRKKDGLRSSCKTCDKISRRKYYEKNRETLIERQKKYAEEHGEERRQYRKKRYETNKDRLLAGSKKYKEEHKEEISEYNKNYKATHKEERNAHEAKRRKENPEVRIETSLRNRLRDAVKSEYKTGSAISNLGMVSGNIKDLKKWLEDQFYDHPITGEKMTWENYGRPNGKLGWDIDHILPLSSADLKNEKQRRKVCNWFNLRPRWAYQNISEGARGMSIIK